MNEDQAENITEETTEDEEVSSPEDEQDPDAEQEAGEGEGEDPEKKDEEGDESGEVELVRDVKGSQPTRKTRSFSNRIKKFKGETQQEKDRADGAESQNAILREQIKLKDIALDQAKNQKPAPVRPNPDDFDGATDPEFIKKQDEFYDHRHKNLMKEELAEFNQTQTQTVSRETEDTNLNQTLDDYFEAADKVSPKDREVKEVEAIGILGHKTVVDIIKIWEEDAPLIVYALGTDTNKGEAEIIRDLVAKDPAKGMLRIERFLSTLSFKPKTKKTAPDPDDELPGGSSSGGKRGPKGATFT